ncbi:unnamed protein product [Trichobilharzia szidati]|nr:unnamed protein product [Trichobilharzia szidati]
MMFIGTRHHQQSIELKLILDPQEYDYIIPNKGYTGFYLIVKSANCQSDNEELDSDHSINDQSVIVGPKFHSFINIKQQYPVERMDRFGLTTKDTCSNFHIQSVVQLEKLPIQIHLLQKFNINMLRRNGTAVHLGVLYQQKAFLQIYNHTAYNLIKELSKELYMARRLAQFASEYVWKMYKHLEHFSRESNQMKLPHNQNIVSCYRQVYHLLTSAGKDLLSSKNALFITDDDEDQDGGNNQTLDSIELHLINSFFETKVIVSPSSTLLRKILTVMMKFRYLLSELSGTTPIYQRNTSFLLASSSASPSPMSTSSFDSISEASQLDTPTSATNNCSHLIMYHEVQIDKSGEAASAALARLDHVNNELHNLIRDNHLARLIFPRSSYPYTELSTSSMVSVTVRLTSWEVPQLYQTSTLYANIYLKNLLLTIFISTLSLYLALFILVELCTFKQNTLTNHISVQCCRLTNQKRGRLYHHQHQHHQNHNHGISHDSCIPLTTDQYNQITSLDVSQPNNFHTCDHECHICNNYDDSRKYGSYYFKCDEDENDKGADIHQIINNPFKQYTTHKHGYNSSGLHSNLLDKPFSTHQNKAATLHTSSIMYMCKDYCQTKAYLDGNSSTVDRNVSIFPGHGQNSPVEHLETPNDLKMPTGFLLTPEEITPVPLSSSSSMISSSSKPPYLHSSLKYQWNLENHIQ